MNKTSFSKVFSLLLITAFLGLQLNAAPLTPEGMSEDVSVLHKRHDSVFSTKKYVPKKREEAIVPSSDADQPLDTTAISEDTEEVEDKPSVGRTSNKDGSSTEVEEESSAVKSDAKEWYTDEWEEIIHSVEPEENPFNNPLDISKFTPVQAEEFKKHLQHSDIMKIGEHQGNPIFADFTNRLRNIRVGHAFYGTYLQVWRRYEKTNKEDEQTVVARLAASFVTIHPRTYFGKLKEKGLIFQEADSGNAIVPSHPHYKLYEARYNENLKEWTELAKEVKDHDVREFAKLSMFDSRVSLIDLSSHYREPVKPEDKEYLVLWGVYMNNKKDDQLLEEVLAGDRKAYPVPTEREDDPDYEVIGYDKNPVTPEHRWHERLNEHRKNN